MGHFAGAQLDIQQGGWGQRANSIIFNQFFSLGQVCVGKILNLYFRRPNLKNLSLCGKNLEFIFQEAEFKEFYPRLKFKPRLKYGWFHLKLYSIFQDLSRRSTETGFWQI